MHARIAPLACLLLSLASCDGGGATEIVVVVDTDIARVDGFEVSATYPSGRAGRSTADLGTEPAPRTLVLLHRGGALGPVRLRISGTEAGEEVLAVEREVTFEQGESLRLFVFLGDGCVGASCGAGNTCGNRGVCRPRAVDGCEYEGRICPATDAGSGDAGRDAGAMDGGGLDGGDCPLVDVCGVAPRVLPGDVIVPVPCAAVAEPVTSAVRFGGAPVTSRGGDPAEYVLAAVGSYTVRLQTSGACYVDTTVDVVTPGATVDTGDISGGGYRDLAARLGLAFVAGSNGAYAAGPGGWIDLRGAIATGTVAPTDLTAVAVHRGNAFFGPNADEDRIYRVEVPADLTSATHTTIAIGGGNKSVRALAVRLDGNGELAVATVSKVVVITNPSGAPTAGESGGDRDPGSDGAIAIGGRSAGDTRGEIWITSPGDLWNRASDDSGGLFNGGTNTPTPPPIGTVHAVEIDDRLGADPRLWLCGETGVHVYRVVGDWSMLSSLPATPDYEWSGRCIDLAVGHDGSAWIASGSGGLYHLSRDAAELAHLDGSSGLPGGAEIRWVATAFDAMATEVWTLDEGRREVLVFSADVIP